jgi:predicted alpha/beta hydrolase family esterase
MGVPRRKLPFPSLLIASSNDPYMSPQRAEHFASAWGAQLINLGARGHINVASGFGPWPEGLQLLSDFASGLAPQPLPTNISINTNQTERA